MNLESNRNRGRERNKNLKHNSEVNWEKGLLHNCSTSMTERVKEGGVSAVLMLL